MPAKEPGTALKRVQANQGNPAVDGMTVQKLPGYLQKHWPTIREQLMSGTDRPQPVKRAWGISLPRMIEQLSRYLNGWRAHFGLCQTPSVLAELDSWIRRHLRSVVWKQWKHGKRRFAELRLRDLGAQTAGSPYGPRRLARPDGRPRRDRTAHGEA